jgi:hypothetical protein
MRLDAPSLTRAALAFALLMGIGAWPWPATSRAWSRLVSAVTNPLLALGSDASAELTPVGAEARRRAGDNVNADMLLTIRVHGRGGQLQFGMSARRDSYLPALIFCALVLAAPVGWRTKGLCFATGLPVLALATIGSIYSLIAYLLAHQAPEVYELTPPVVAVLDFLLERWLLPPGNRVIAPLLLAGSLLAVVSARRAPAPQLTAASTG